jgi:hypothetical protein
MKAARRLRQVYIYDEEGHVIELNESPYRLPKSFFRKKEATKASGKLIKKQAKSKPIPKSKD